METLHHLVDGMCPGQHWVFFETLVPTPQKGFRNPAQASPGRGGPGKGWEVIGGLGGGKFGWGVCLGLSGVLARPVSPVVQRPVWNAFRFVGFAVT